MPESVIYLETPRVRVGVRLGSNDALLWGPDALIRACRLKCQATLPELTAIVESLNEARALVDLTPPYLVMAFQDPQDVSQEYAVFDEASAIQVDLIYVRATVRDSVTDSAQLLRAELTVLERAFLQDRTLGGLVTRMEVAATPANRANQYQQTMQTDGQPVTILPLTLLFHLVSSVAPLYL